MRNLIFAILALTFTFKTFAAIPNPQFSDLKRTILSEKAHYTERWAATLRLVDIDDPRIESELLSLSERKEWFLRNAALLGMQKIQPRKAYDLAKKLIKDQALVVRSAALQVMRAQLQPQDRNLLWSELNQKYNFRAKESLWIRRDIAGTLSESPTSREFTLFQKLIGDADEEIQFQAAMGLDKLSGLHYGSKDLQRKEFIKAWRQQVADNTPAPISTVPAKIKR